MADPISKAAALERMKSMAGCATCNNYNYVRCRACIWDDAMNIVDEAPTIDAIPVAWLNQKYAENEPGEDKDYDYFLWDAIAYILTEWQNEQEVQDG